MTVLPDGRNYDLSNYDDRVAARQNNPAYVVDSSGYLLRGSGGAPSSDPSRGGSGNDGGTGSGREVMPWIEGGAGTGSPNGYTGAPISVAQQISLAQAVSGAANNLIPAGPGGANIVSIAQQISAGTPAQQAIRNLIGSAAPAGGPPTTYAAPQVPASAQQPAGTLKGPLLPGTSGGGLPGSPLLWGLGALALILALRQ